MSKTPYMPMWVSDFLGKTLALDTKEIGAYLLLIMALWQAKGSLPFDEKLLRRVTRTNRDWPRIWARLSPFFNVADGVLTQDRVTEELKKLTDKREVMGQLSAQAVKAKALKRNKPHQPNGLPTITITKEEDKSSSKKSRFDQFLAEEIARNAEKRRIRLERENAARYKS